MSAKDLYNDFISWNAVIREFEIIGEAVNKVIKAGLLSENRRDGEELLLQQDLQVILIK